MYSYDSSFLCWFTSEQKWANCYEWTYDSNFKSVKNNKWLMLQIWFESYSAYLSETFADFEMILKKALPYRLIILIWDN